MSTDSTRYTTYDELLITFHPIPEPSHLDYCQQLFKACCFAIENTSFAITLDASVVAVFKAFSCILRSICLSPAYTYKNV